MQTNQIEALPYSSRRAQRVERLWSAALGVALFAGLTALGAQVKVPLPNTPVPMTLQTVFVVLSGMCLGPLGGLASQSLYLGLGLLGLPVFADGQGGIAYAVGPTAGYLVGFLFASVVAGWATGPQASGVRVCFGTLMAWGLIFGCGVGWLCLGVTHGDVGRALALGLYPFWLGAAFKWSLTVALGWWQWRRRRFPPSSVCRTPRTGL